MLFAMRGNRRASSTGRTASGKVAIHAAVAVEQHGVRLRGAPAAAVGHGGTRPLPFERLARVGNGYHFEIERFHRPTPCRGAT